MSLEVAAKYLAAHGRGPDDQLVHMSSKEVAGLESIAKAMGGSLTINPDTGLTEAGFLDDVAPLVIGAGLAYMAPASLGMELAGSDLLGGLGAEILGGLSNEAIIGGGLGLAGTVLSGGNIGQGLRWGLGGYGGATAATAGMNYMNQPPAPTVVETTPGAFQSVNNTVPVAGTPVVQPAVVTPQGAPVIPAEGAIPPVAAPTEMSAAQASKLIADEQAASASYFDKALDWAGQHPYITAGIAAAPFLLKKPSAPTGTSNPQMIRPHTYTRNAQVPANMVGASYVPGQDTSERQWFNPYYTALPPYQAADGGIIALAGGGPVEQMSNNAVTGANTMYPMANMRTSAFATPYQTPQSTNMMAPSGGGTVDMMSGEPNMQGTRMAAGGISGSGHLDLNIPLDFGSNDTVINGYQAVGSGGGNQNTNSLGVIQPKASTPFGPQSPGFGAADGPITTDPFSPISSDTFQGTGAFGGGNPQSLISLLGALNGKSMANGGMASGGITNLGGYSDGGRLLRGPGDGVSDSIPAQIGDRQPARLADGEFVVPARIVSELGNGSTDAGARQLYKMMDRVQQARGKTTGKSKVAKNTNAAKYLPA